MKKFLASYVKQTSRTGRQTNLMNAPLRELSMNWLKSREDRSGQIEILIFGQESDSLENQKRNEKLEEYKTKLLEWTDRVPIFRARDFVSVFVAQGPPTVSYYLEAILKAGS